MIYDQSCNKIVRGLRMIYLLRIQNFADDILFHKLKLRIIWISYLLLENIIQCRPILFMLGAP